MSENIIAYQGVEGAYSHLACKNAYPNMIPKACDSFMDAMWMVEEGEAKYAMIPLENSTAGRVEEIYRLIPKMSLSIVAEHFEPVVHCLLSLPKAKIEDIKYVSSHPQALAQCHLNITKLGLIAEATFDTAGAAKEVLERGDIKRAAIASKLAAKLYGLKILREHFEDEGGNVTRFFVLAKKGDIPFFDKKEEYITSLLFQVRNIPAALYKALGGFATNGINLIKLESYNVGSKIQASLFHVDIEAHPDMKRMKYALEELAFFAEDVRILGVYKKHPFRKEFKGD